MMVLCLAAPVLVLVAVHRVPGLASWGADTLRAAVGVRAVARLEDAVYEVRDLFNRAVRGDQAPKSYWKVEAAKAQSAEPGAVSMPGTEAPDADALGVAPEATAEIKNWEPPMAVVPFAQVATESDGKWVPLDPSRGELPLRKTMIHPDPKRTWAELFVVAIDVKSIKLHWVPGSHEPSNRAEGAESLNRSARIPSSVVDEVLGAFNGGFKTQHGKFGARSEGITLVTPRPHSCTLGEREDGTLALGTHKDLEGSDELSWLRQTPPCMVEGGELHPGLVHEDTKNWGATLSGGTVIRRSALGMSQDGTTLFVGISNDTTARALALGMKSVGAATVAQLDVNYVYPKFVLFESSEGSTVPHSLVDGFVVSKNQYLKSEARDFFYVTRSK